MSACYTPYYYELCDKFVSTSSDSSSSFSRLPLTRRMCWKKSDADNAKYTRGKRIQIQKPLLKFTANLLLYVYVVKGQFLRTHDRHLFFKFHRDARSREMDTGHAHCSMRPFRGHHFEFTV